MTRVLLLGLVALSLLPGRAAAQGADQRFNTVKITATANSLCVGVAVGAACSTADGFVYTGKLVVYDGIALSGGTPSTAGIVLPAATPSSTTSNLYSPDGVALWFGSTQLATGSSVSGTTNKVGKFTGVATVGDSSITDDGSTVSTPLPFGASTITLSSSVVHLNAAQTRYLAWQTVGNYFEIVGAELRAATGGFVGALTGTVNGFTINQSVASGAGPAFTNAVLTTPNLGTPSAAVLTNATGLPAASVVAGSFGAGAFTFSTQVTGGSFVATAGYVTDGANRVHLGGATGGGYVLAQGANATTLGAFTVFLTESDGGALTSAGVFNSTGLTIPNAAKLVLDGGTNQTYIYRYNNLVMDFHVNNVLAMRLYEGGSGNTSTIDTPFGWNGGAAITSSSNVAQKNATNAFSIYQQINHPGTDAFIEFLNSGSSVGLIGNMAAVGGTGPGIFARTGFPIQFWANASASFSMTLSTSGDLSVTGDVFGRSVTVGTNNIILGSNYLSGDGGDEGIAVASDGSVSVIGPSNTTSTPYYFDTSSSAAISWVRGGEGVTGQINIAGDDGDDNDDIFTIASLGGGDVRFRNGAGSNYLTFSGLTAMSLPAGMTLTIPDLASSLGTRYVCSDVAGTLVDSVSACSGSDAEAIASVPKLWQEIYALRAEIAGLLRTGPTAVATLRPGDVVR